MKRFASFLIALSIICLIGGFSYAADKGNARFQSFSKVKNLLLRQVYSDHLKTFYCDCDFTIDKRVSHATDTSQRKLGIEPTG